MSDAAPDTGRQTVLTALPLLEALPRQGDSYEPKKVEEAFDAFRRHIAALQSELYELKIRANKVPDPLPGEAPRAETLELVRTASELAQAIEQDARDTAARQLARLEDEQARRRRELEEREATAERERRQVHDAAVAEARAQLTEAERRAAQERAQAEAEAEKILQQARREANELRASAQSEIERMMEQAARSGGQLLAPPEQNGTAAPAVVPTSEPPPPTAEPAPSTPEPASSSVKPAPTTPEPAASFSAPPLSPEDLAARSVSRLRADSESLLDQ
jgi:multidrug efflux pump subunit AcrA (membrane-fusion protein)